MRAEKFLQTLSNAGIHYFTGVPDSQLSAFTDAVVAKYGFDEHHHTVAVNEGCAVGLAAGFHLSTGGYACVYMQNSGLGNAVNPITSLLNKEAYSIGCLFVIGWRGEPDKSDEPQHSYMGKITLPLLDLLGIRYLVIDENTDGGEFDANFRELSVRLGEGESIAVVVKKNALEPSAKKLAYANGYKLSREEVVGSIAAAASEKDVIVSTTGKISRELYEYEKSRGNKYCRSFLTVGSMGHCSSIALAIASIRDDKRVVVIDGDGAAFMHMGALAAIGRKNPQNLIHILLDNGAHETVGGMPTGSESADFCKIALGAGYCEAVDISGEESSAGVSAKLDKIFGTTRSGAIFVRIRVAVGSRENLSRPQEKATDNKARFMYNMCRG